MVWDIEDVEKHKKGLKEKQKKQWVKIANKMLTSCLKKGVDQKECETAAIKTANSVVGNASGQLLQNEIIKNTGYVIRKEMLNGEQYLVVPVVMLVEGVHEGSAGKVFYSAEELSKYPSAWNGRYVPVYHPTQGEENVSCNSPEMIEKYAIGQIFNASFNEAKKALVSELWIDEEKTRRISPEVLTRILSGGNLEVSTGMLFDDINTLGKWNGEDYDIAAVNILPDHLAVLPDEEGACSWKDGCGVRFNRKYIVHGGAGSGNFGHEGRPGEIGGSGEGTGGGGKTSKEKVAKVKSVSGVRIDDSVRDVVRKALDKKLTYKDIVDAIKDDISTKDWWEKYSKDGKNEFNLRQDLESAFNSSRKMEYSLGAKMRLKLNQNEMSDLDLRDKLVELLSPQQSVPSFPSDNYKYLEGVYDDYFIFVEQIEEERKYFKQIYSVDSKGSINLEDAPQEMKKEIVYSPVENQKKGGGNMVNEKKDVDFILGVKQMGYGEGDRDRLTNMESAIFINLKSYAQKFADCKECNGVQGSEKKADTLEELISNATLEIQEMINDGVKMVKEKKASLIASIKANKRNKFTDAQLIAKSPDELEMIEGLAAVEVDYSLQNAAGASQGIKANERTAEGLGVPVAPIMDWSKKGK